MHARAGNTHAHHTHETHTHTNTHLFVPLRLPNGEDAHPNEGIVRVESVLFDKLLRPLENGEQLGIHVPREKVLGLADARVALRGLEGAVRLRSEVRVLALELGEEGGAQGVEEAREHGHGWGLIPRARTHSFTTPSFLTAQPSCPFRCFLTTSPIGVPGAVSSHLKSLSVSVRVKVRDLVRAAWWGSRTPRAPAHGHMRAHAPTHAPTLAPSRVPSHAHTLALPLAGVPCP